MAFVSIAGWPNKNLVSQDCEEKYLPLENRITTKNRDPERMQRCIQTAGAEASREDGGRVCLLLKKSKRVIAEMRLHDCKNSIISKQRSHQPKSNSRK
jgi:hypothetical protein